MGVISGALSLISAQFNFSLGQSSIFASILLFGALLGSGLAGYLIKVLGRKKVFFLSALLIVIGCLLVVKTSSFSFLLFARVLKGIGIGLVSVVTPLYLGEIAPSEHRGKIVSAYQLLMCFGVVAAFLVNAFFHRSSNWQDMFLVGLLPAVIQIFLLFFIAESPLWLFQQQKEKKGNQILMKLGLETSFVKEEKVQTQESSSLDLFSFLLWIGVFLSVFQQVGGINTLIYYSPRIFQAAGYTSAFSALLATIAVGVSNLVGCGLSCALSDRIGRKKLLLLGLFGMTVSLLTLCASSFFQSPWSDDLSVFLLIVYIFFFALGPGPITWVLLSEIFPEPIRGKGMTFALLANWSSVFIVLWLFPFLLEWIKIEGTFGFYSFMNIIAIIFVLKFIPETKNKTFKEIFYSFKKMK
jgi:SP family xylose:H+ symportor-like MFS transporter